MVETIKITVDVEIPKGKYCLNCPYEQDGLNDWCSLFDETIFFEKETYQDLKCEQCLKASELLDGN